MDVADMYYLYVATFRCQTDTSDEWFIWQVPVVGDMDATSTAQMAQAWLLGQEVTESDGAPRRARSSGQSTRRSRSRPVQSRS